MNTIQAIIVDDEQSARENLRQILDTHCPEVKILGEAHSVIEGIKLVRKVKPEVIFLDINLNEELGFDLIDCLEDVDFKVIFTTAYDKYAVQAFRYGALHYLTKPLDIDAVKEAVGRSVELGQDKTQLDLVKDAYNSKTSDRLALSTNQEVVIVDISKIVRLKADGAYTTFFMDDGHEIMVSKSIKEYTNLLSNRGFFRVHRSSLIRMDKIKKLVKNDGGYVVMKDDTQIPISRLARQQFLDELGSFLK